MDQVNLGGSGLLVSRLILGCMSYGDPSRGQHGWVLTGEEARPFIKRALDAGVTTFDTANSYSLGASEETLGRLIAELTNRDEVVIATKVWGRVEPGPKGQGLSRNAILTQADRSLRRLGTDYIDIYQIHRYDPNTPIEETMEALHDLVRSGKVRYIGASSMWTWQFARMQHAADRHGWTRFVSMQDQYNLLMREEEREMLPYCAAEGIGVIPWSPLARGRLARPWDETTHRGERDRLVASFYRQAEDASRRIIDVVGEVAGERGVSRAQVALAWLLHKPAVTAPIVGATRPEHLEDAIAALELELDEDEIERLEEPYRPVAPEGFA